MYNFHLYLSGKRKNAQGLAPVYAKIDFNGKKFERSAGIFVVPGNWSNAFKRVAPEAINATAINEAISLFEAKLNTYKNVATIADLDRLLAPKTNTLIPTFMQSLDDYITTKEKIIGQPDGITLSTYYTYISRRKNIYIFMCEKKLQYLAISDFNAIIGEGLKVDLSSKFGAARVNKHLILCRSVITWAINEYSIPGTNFLNLKNKKEAKKRPIYLTIEELSTIEKYLFASPMLQKAADIFLLQCYTGMSYMDVVKLDLTIVEHYQGNAFIAYKRGKNKNDGLLPLNPKVAAILAKYGGIAPKMANQTCNRLNKEIAAIVGIYKKLTTHVGRKTFATLQLTKGYSMEVVTKMLAKNSISETAKTYAEVTHQLMINQHKAINWVH